MNGHYTGWVEESVRAKLGLAESAAVRQCCGDWRMRTAH